MPHPTRILLIGPNGQVGWELRRTLAPLGEVVTAGRTGTQVSLDLADPDSMVAALREVRPTWVVNAGAYTAVDKAEEEPELAMSINGTAPGILAEESKRLGAALIHYSTDYVFDGSKRAPYTEDDEPCPINVYGKTKLAGERAVESVDGAHLILRTSWVYGARGRNFLLTMLRLFRERTEVRVVDDQVGSPTWCRSIADATGRAMSSLGAEAGACHERRGLYHLSAMGTTSWYGFAQAIYERAKSEDDPGDLCTRQLVPIATDQYPTPAARPGYSVLNTSRLSDTFNISMPTWHEGLADCLAEKHKVEAAA